jgi:uncharacterized membrane protein YphA (DoxX/SURF4 family)
MLKQLIPIDIMLIMFFTSGVDKVLNFDKTVEGFIKKVPISTRFMAIIAILSAIAIEIFAPILINYGHFYNKHLAALGLGSLIIFTILATIIYHFPPIGRHYYPFMSNLTTFGGLLLALTLYI